MGQAVRSAIPAYDVLALLTTLCHGPEEIQARHNQCPRRKPDGQQCLARCFPAQPLSRTRGQLYRVEAGGCHDEAALGFRNGRRRAFALAGVYRHWRSPDGKSWMDTFAIVTTELNELLAEKTGHDRMPVVIKRADYQRWLEPGNEERPPIDLIRPFDSEKMKAWRVDRRVNNVRNNEPSLIEPVMDEAPPGEVKPVEKSKRKAKA